MRFSRYMGVFMLNKKRPRFDRGRKILNECIVVGAAGIEPATLCL